MKINILWSILPLNEKSLKNPLWKKSAQDVRTSREKKKKRTFNNFQIISDIWNIFSIFGILLVKIY